MKNKRRVSAAALRREAVALCVVLICPLLSCSFGGNSGPQPVSSSALSQQVSSTASSAASVSSAQSVVSSAPASASAASSAKASSAVSEAPSSAAAKAFDIADIPAFSGTAYIAVNGNEPYFSPAELTEKSFESYSDPDSLGRCGVAFACVGKDLMPTEERGSIGSVKPSGWQTVKYDFVDGKYLYNRCHLIGYQLSGENANVKNLITGTRYMNVDGMLPFENMVADYVKETGNHVMYRVTPVFVGKNLVAAGVLMEAYSVEDGGDGVCYNVFCYNNQPGVAINYADGTSEPDGSQTSSAASSKAASSEAASSTAASSQEPASSSVQTYILNTNTHKFHLPGCAAVKTIAPANYEESDKTRDELIAAGYSPCGKCHP